MKMISNVNYQNIKKFLHNTSSGRKAKVKGICKNGDFSFIEPTQFQMYQREGK